MKKLFNSSKAFTLIELLVVIAVVAVLAVAVVTAINPASKINSGKNSTVKSDLSQIVGGLQAYYTQQASPSYPATLSAITPNEIKTLPKQQAGNGDCEGAAGTDVTDYCYTGVAGSAVAVWGRLFDGTGFWCWDSTSGVYKTSATAVLTPTAQTTCP